MESRDYVCVPSKACLLRGTRKAASNLISPESKYLYGGKCRFTMVDIFPTFCCCFFFRTLRGGSSCAAEYLAIFSRRSSQSTMLVRDFHSMIITMMIATRFCTIRIWKMSWKHLKGNISSNFLNFFWFLRDVPLSFILYLGVIIFDETKNLIVFNFKLIVI